MIELISTNLLSQLKLAFFQQLGEFSADISLISSEVLGDLRRRRLPAEFAHGCQDLLLESLFEQLHHIISVLPAARLRVPFKHQGAVRVEVTTNDPQNGTRFPSFPIEPHGAIGHGTFAGRPEDVIHRVWIRSPTFGVVVDHEDSYTLLQG